MVGTKPLYEFLEFGVLNMEFKANFPVLVYHFNFINYYSPFFFFMSFSSSYHFLL